MTFEYWLNKFMKNDSAIGDLARDYKRVCNDFRLMGKSRPKLTFEHLQSLDACEEAIEAFHKARNLYATEISNWK